VFVRAKETVYYGEVRRKGPVFEQDEQGRERLKAHGQVFKIRERKGRDKNNRNVTLTVEHQYRAIKDAVDVIRVTQSNFDEIKAAEIEARQVEAFERDQADIDAIDAMKTPEELFGNKKPSAPSLEERLDDEVVNLEDENNNMVILEDEESDIEAFASLKPKDENESFGDVPADAEAINSAQESQSQQIEDFISGDSGVGVGTGDQNVIG
jgi:hypothetical protein